MVDQPFWITVIAAFIVLNVMLVGMAYMTWFERRMLAQMQDRIGPNRTGPFGLLQPIADGVKLLAKEDIIPENADRRIFLIAPLITFVTAPLIALFIPFGDPVTIAGQEISLAVSDISVAALFVIGISSVGTYGIILGGYASANRYSLLGALRSAAQVISYEIVLGLSLVGVFMLSGSLSLVEIVNEQRQTLDFFGISIPNWFIFSQPLAFVLFMIAGVAETNRPPFDLPEAETELTGGFHTEYSGFRWSFYFLGEFIAVIVISLLAATLFLGGIDGPIKDGVWWLLPKTFIFLFFFVWLRATLPRFRYDQLMGLAWKVLLPLVLFNVMLTGLIILIRDGEIFLGVSTEVLVFDILAIVAVIAALGVVLARNPVHSAVALVVTFIHLAAIFVMLHAEFLAAVQILVYTGAVTVLIVFVIFLVRVDDLPEFYGGNPVQRIFALLIGLALLGEMAAAILTRSAIGDSDVWTSDTIAAAGGNVQVIGQLLYSDYVLPIQITAIVLLVGTVAALVLARPESSTLPGRSKRTGLISLAHPRGADRDVAGALPVGLEATRRGEVSGVRFDDRGVVLVDNAEAFTESTAWGGDELEEE